MWESEQEEVSPGTCTIQDLKVQVYDNVSYTTHIMYVPCTYTMRYAYISRYMYSCNYSYKNTTCPRVTIKYQTIMDKVNSKNDKKEDKWLRTDSSFEEIPVQP